MDRTLFAYEETDRHRDFLAQAGELAAGVDAELVVLSLVGPDELADSVDALEAMGEVVDVSQGTDTILSAVRSETESAVSSALSEVDVETTVAAAAADETEEANAIIDAADRHECDHLFVVGEKRSPTGKAIFGDATQRIVLGFDGSVTVLTA